MAVQPQLDVVGGARKGRVIPFLLVLFGLIIPSVPGFAQDHGPEEARLAAARKAFDGARWDEAARLAEGPSDQSSQLDLLQAGRLNPSVPHRLPSGRPPSALPPDRGPGRN